MAIWRLAGVGVLGLGLLGCVNNTALDDLKDTTPEGSAFNKALFKDYSILARSFGEVGAAAGVAFDTEGSFELTEMDSGVGALANAYAEKALLAARGSLVEPEPGVDIPTHKARDRLIRALERGKDGFPADSARAQAEYDCWLLNMTVAQTRAASKKCLAGYDKAIKRLEAEAKPAPAPAPAAPATDNSDKPAVQP
ncbi:MAG TPA: hypothetical protein VG889_00450 [Rhizomicrobium sp.]|nr:hypothetical protein [Rhizomicrobium sp.]